MPSLVFTNLPLTLVAGALSFGLACGCSPERPTDLRVDYTAVAVVPEGLAGLFDADKAPGHINALLDLEPHETGIVLSQLTLTTADRQHGELKGSRFAVEQVHRAEGDAPLLLAKIRRARVAGELKVERHLHVDRPAILGRFTGELSSQELTKDTRQRHRGGPVEVEIAIVAHARHPG